MAMKTRAESFNCADEYGSESNKTLIPDYRIEREYRKAFYKKPDDGKSIENWLLRQRMSNENLYRQQMIHDGEIVSLEAKVRGMEGRLRWLEVTSVILVFLCGGLLVCQL